MNCAKSLPPTRNGHPAHCRPISRWSATSFRKYWSHYTHTSPFVHALALRFSARLGNEASEVGLTLV